MLKLTDPTDGLWTDRREGGNSGLDITKEIAKRVKNKKKLGEGTMKKKKKKSVFKAPASRAKNWSHD